MRQAHVVVYEPDGRVAERLRELSERHGFVVREVRHGDACLNTLSRFGPGLVILKVGRDLERELSLLEQLAALHPVAPVIVVGDSDNPTLEGLCWDLGARYVLFPPQSIELLRELAPAFVQTP